MKNFLNKKFQCKRKINERTYKSDKQDKTNVQSFNLDLDIDTISTDLDLESYYDAYDSFSFYDNDHLTIGETVSTLVSSSFSSNDKYILDENKTIKSSSKSVPFDDEEESEVDQ